MPVLSKRIVLDCFYLLIFYFEKFSTDVCRLPCAVNVNLNLSNFAQFTFRHLYFTNSLVIVYVSRRDINIPIKARGLPARDVTTIGDLTVDGWCTSNQGLFQLRNTF